MIKGNVGIDFSLENIWLTWEKYKRGKHKSSELLDFQQNLEANLLKLSEKLRSGRYGHGIYRKFRVTDNKPRIISVAGIQDRIVHRLIYDYLVVIYDHTFDYDIWSCRKNKGLVAAISRTRCFAKKYENIYFWRSDVRRFFESINRGHLLGIVKSKLKDEKAIWLIGEVVGSFTQGISIGNLTSQIFANIYLNEFDRFVRNNLRPKAYLRYGDDFIVFDSRGRIQALKNMAEFFLNTFLCLKINGKSDYIGKITLGIKFLGCRIYPDRTILNKRNQKRIFRKLNPKNSASYYGLIKQFGNKELKKKLDWELLKHT